MLYEIKFTVKILKILPYLVHVSSEFAIPIDENNNQVVLKAADCLLDISKIHFVFGSSVGIVVAGLQNYTSANLSNNSPDASLRNLMLSESWTIIVKQGHDGRPSKAKVWAPLPRMCYRITIHFLLSFVRK